MKKVLFFLILLSLPAVSAGALSCIAGIGADTRIGISPDSFIAVAGPDIRFAFSPVDYFETGLSFYSGALVGSQYSFQLDALGVIPAGAYWRPAAGINCGITFGSSLDYYQSSESTSTFFYPFYSVGITLIPVRFETGTFRFSFLELMLSSDLAQFGKSIILDLKLLTLSYLFKKRANTQTGESIPADDHPGIAPAWYLSMGVGGLTSGIRTYQEPAVPLAVTFRAGNLWDTSFLVKWLPQFSYITSLYLETLFAPRIANYQPALGAGVSLVFYSSNSIPLWAPYIAVIPCRFLLDDLLEVKDFSKKSHSHSLYFSLLETRFGPFVNIPAQNNRQGGTLFFNLEFFRIGYEF